MGIGTLDADEKLHVVGKGKFTEGLDVTGEIDMDGDINITGATLSDATLTNATLSGDTEFTDNFNFTTTLSDISLTEADFKISDGQNSDYSLAIDANDIQARKPGDIANTLHLNGFGGQVMVNLKPVPVGEENLRIIRGIINADGTKFNGSGFTSTKTSTGHYEIDFGTSFNDAPAVTFGTLGANRGASASNINTSTVKVSTWKTQSSNVEYANVMFSFIAIGSR